jgi:tetratricopeptide (TPR) repeat protein
MKSGLWILIIVIVVGIVVGALLRDRLRPVEEVDRMAELREIGEIEDPEAKISALEAFITTEAESRPRSRAYYMIGREILRALEDTTRFVDLARETIEEEADAESKAIMYYLLYNVESATSVQAGALLGHELLDNPIEAGWIYNHIGYSLAEQGGELDLALTLCDRAIGLAETGEDSASYFDSRGWVYYMKEMYPEAVSDLEMAADLFDEPFEETLQHLGYACLGAGYDDKAFETFKTILVMGEYDYARSILDSLMTVRGYSETQMKDFESSIWEERTAGAELAGAFNLPTLAGADYEFAPPGNDVTLINFMSPT